MLQQRALPLRLKIPGEVQKVEMKDDVTKVQISKTDISGKELPGAKLTILDKDGKTVESWTSEENHTILKCFRLENIHFGKRLHQMDTW